MRPPTANAITQGVHGTSKAVDYGASPDPYVYAPEDMTFDSYMQRGSGVNDAGNALRGRGKTGLHQFAHLSETYWKSGTVKKGAKIAKMGHTGFTIPAGVGGTHLHYWVETSRGYVYPPSLITEPFGGSGNKGGEDMYKGKSAKQWYSVAEDRRKRIIKAHNALKVHHPTGNKK